MPGLGYVSLGTKGTKDFNVGISLDESICGMLFDISHYDDVFSSHLLAEGNLSDNQIVLVNNLEEAEAFGIDSEFMSGIPHYHIKEYYDYIGIETPLYVLFSDCSYWEGNVLMPDFSIIEDMQRACYGKMFQIGVWTEFPVWSFGEDEYGFTGLIPKIQEAAELVSGQTGLDTNESSPLNVMLFANTFHLDNGDAANYKKIPSAMELGCHRVSLVLGQNGSSEIHSMQNSIESKTPVGSLGFAMACLTLAAAEESISWVGEFDLNKNDSMVVPELGFGSNYMPISDLNEIRRDIISSKGYILPTVYKAKEAGVFFSSNATLSEGDYGSIANNRVINKCRRIIKRAMFSHINAVFETDPISGELTSANISILTNEIIDALDRYLVNKQGQSQVNGRDVTIETTKNIMLEDRIAVKCHFIPANSNSVINVEEYFNLNN